MKKVLMVTYYFPPISGSGVQRPLKFIKYLPGFGWNPVVLTVKNSSFFLKDETILDDIPKDLIVKRTFTLERDKVLGWLKKAAGRKKKKENHIRDSGTKKLPLKTKIINALTFPDAQLGWLPFAVISGIRLARKEKADAIFTTLPPQTAHLAGYFIKLFTKIPWIADYRDPWDTFVPSRGLKSIVNRFLEHMVLKNADRILCVNDKLAGYILERYKGIKKEKFAVISNGFDPEDFENISRKENKKFTVNYCGVFNAYIKPDPFLLALRKWLDEDGKRKNNIEVNFIGATTDEIVNFIKDNNLQDIVRHRGYLSHKEAVYNMVNADCLLLFVDEGRDTSFIQTSKIFEYLKSGTPVLAIVPDCAAADLIKAANAGIVVPPSDIDEIKNAIDVFYKVFLKGMAEHRAIDNVVERFNRKLLTEKLAELLDNMI